MIDSLAGDADRLWPTHDWPPMRFDRHLAVGAIGGHGPVRYVIEGYQPGHWIRFRFTGPRGFDGFHEFTVHDEGDTATLRHLLAMHARGPARLTWPLVYRRLHDALLEDSLDRAEQELTGRPPEQPAQHDRYVRLLRGFARRFT
ncbi:SRPBCC family protein [Nocardia cyriacigeorgica]|uniref:SRPBCC family protein n=1 Tax=Nocardia cyriacigeorgica TaxID=135487 RepID=UPI001C49C8E6|nr:SRPBCC family protein [Nocardia cyriacigeorgica]